MNVGTAISHLVTITESLQKDRTLQEARMRNLQLRMHALTGAVTVLGLIVLIRGIRGS